ncbi:MULTISPECIES: MogA/MoaB family molybdenum cofactor biosynthesis protein [Thermodesulfobacterium]|jgi:molybdenum cofactor synthesis domain-containing protein|uniref:Molybdopterin adenylyltransferase n=2 Tax=Thermodesulfobacterium commune TaxID=1741 RepID=A0A075WSG2_9BACT|nr:MULTISPECIES: MogA/MoaB family molybdenum cofactor biosynthesis protein [Thermodesulfobacterium]KUJ98007.1 MAG: Molybdenum cofactor synthesis domain protein [Thermodesulfobacterium sp. 37_54]KUK19595.1 MAG: Molybdenum cofactor synthesis domain protein [Thermodesulfobacterium commune]AIH03960.1 cytoplasmic protein [Thermodesulfobacterium commune DSM 2178]KUK38363.1 MAG: Molybdenum cofactor synthesis domain protein [Thermodesulfobacterium commune]MBZ4681850.1 cytoplasmic protein [Thermodesulf
MIKVGILTLSDKGFKGEREDKTGELLKTLVEKEGWLVSKYLILPDEKEKIVEVLTSWADKEKLDLIVTNGGTGVYPRDVTPEATKEIIEKEIPGIPEFIRYISYPLTPMAALTRGIAGVRGKTLIINLPGSPKAISEIFPSLIPIIKHAVEKIKGDPSECARN